ncbi:MAG: glutathione S-transferase [Hyphomicrobiaceae bacterium]|nr:glutathione S-transferase [Hyphomicrobiaceae bacterium]
MRLLSAPASPFGRKVKIVAHLKGLAGRIAIEATDTRDPSNLTLREANPLGKIPVLILDDGTTIYDSHVICEYLDGLAPTTTLFPPSGRARAMALTRAALADGIMEARVLMVYEERFREPPERSATWVARQQSKSDAGLAALDRAAADGVLDWSSTSSAHPTYDHVAIACALGYLDLRFPGSWREGHPSLVAWLDRFSAAVPSFETTRATA